jgi:hypothetical protein
MTATDIPSRVPSNRGVVPWTRGTPTNTCIPLPKETRVTIHRRFTNPQVHTILHKHRETPLKCITILHAHGFSFSIFASSLPLHPLYHLSTVNARLIQ